MLVDQAYNPSYSGGRDQEDHNLKLAQAKQFSRPYLKKNHHKVVLMEWFKVKVLSLNPQYCKKQNKMKQNKKTINHIHPPFPSPSR
jgi:hypothetical protein